MKIKKTIYYWSPHINSTVATVKAVLNSLSGLNKYSDNYDVSLINVFGEWSYYKNKKKNDINFINLFLARKLDYRKDIVGYFKSRMFYLFVGFFSIVPLFNLIKKKKPDILIVHLLSFIPLILNIIFNFHTKIVLRISGFPKLNFFRVILWKLNSKKIEKIICPTLETMKLLIEKNIFPEEKVILIEDPILEISKISSLRKEEIPNVLINKKYILSIGRLSVQKNFKLLLEFFEMEEKIDANLFLVIVGEGEERKNIERIILEKKIENKVFLLGYKKNIHNLLKHCYCFILSSLWEDPGFVLIEAAVNNASIISSDCKSGPKEILSNGKGGLLFNSNNILSLKNSYDHFKKLNNNDIFVKKYYSKKKAQLYSKFRHFKKLDKFLTETLNIQ